MSGYKLFTSVIALALIHLCHGQNLELVENKGQWDPAVKYKGQLLNGAIFLGANSYKVLQQNGDDLAKVTGALLRRLINEPHSTLGNLARQLVLEFVEDMFERGSHRPRKT